MRSSQTAGGTEANTQARKTIAQGGTSHREACTVREAARERPG